MKSIYFTLILLSSFVLFPIISDAQDTEEEKGFTLSGKVIDAATLKGIPFSHIKIDDTYWGVICDSLGFFKVSIKSNHSLRVSSLSYAEIIVPITSEVTDGEAFQEISLERMSYMLEEVDIYSLGTWKQFKENFAKMELLDEEHIAGGWNFGNLKSQMKEALTMDRSGAGMSFTVNRKYKDGKQRELVAKLKSNEYKSEIIKSKFNKQLVAEITHETGERLDALMVYITEREHFSYQSRDIYIQRRIKACYDTFVLEYVEGEYDYALDDSTKILRNNLRK
ncbi:carboxypeptidase-like regulatory domain-containing protein [Ancylomarina sp. 16SWW S1-10-2]|uniref:carboxypeptidase-like regulatory domain-containing protein n=1 Tax=Ancylomarina sp. 16SWW S1-10-2 TaxID=2499681 RepID=UPI0012AE2064|nr:carboxypeptidase-like regulatory domain-containing protein [Ancylomarina sp. 16SWW S1-10-2]MRT92292.1 hypothetical protein [Ancylomarina sp. 16SWW S1-10-2]